MPAVEMQVEQVTLDPVLGAPVVILREKEGNRTVPIWIGQGEAAAIVSELRKVSMARPSTHDLMKDMLFRLRADVVQVSITDLQNGTFFAEVGLQTTDGAVRVDSRPSDAIALALRVGAPIWVEHEVMEKAFGLETLVDSSICEPDINPSVLLDTVKDASDGFLEGLCEDDFGKWKM
jgi:uncharacterized protein